MSGLVTMIPSSIEHVGTSAVINANGGVDFTAVTSLSLDGVFTPDFDNYLIIQSCTGPEDKNVSWKLRVNKQDTTGSDYVRQYLYAADNSISGNRIPGQSGMVIGRTAPSGGDEIHIYGPFLPQPTAVRSVNVSGRDGARIEADNAHTHSLPVSYDGFTLFPAADSFTGSIIVMGYAE